ncbi:MAG TPA: cytochrome c biogenesis protein CcsA [Bacteroidales bacterium]|nr:cytochrome c biogenesis protein CcsA [Bacteroidales bacterium]
MKDTLRKIVDLFFSMVTTVVLLLFYAFGIGYATFVENAQGTEVAKALIYNAHWLECVYLLLVVNLIGSIFKYQLVRKQKRSILVFHLAFLLMLTGAGITRFNSSEGLMHIREGQSSNEISSDKTSLHIEAYAGNQRVERSIETQISEKSKTSLSESLEVGGKTITVEKEFFVPNAFETIVPDQEGEPAISLFVLDQANNRLDGILTKNKRITFQDLTIAFSDSAASADVVFSETKQGVQFVSNLPVSEMGMMNHSQKMYQSGQPILVVAKTLYTINHLVLVIKTYLPQAKINLTQAVPGADASGIMREGRDAVVFKVSDGNQVKRMNVFSDSNPLTEASSSRLGDVSVRLSYGVMPKLLPFSIKLRDFELERYPGSNSPSSYASEITVIDPERKMVLPYRIFMNNILNYRGYRFFQSSYDQDEQGTILSVSHDYWGTLITYAGYLMLIIGLIWTLFNKQSRFRTLLKWSSELQKKRQKVLFVSLMLITVGAQAQTVTKNQHLNQVDRLLVQDMNQGRIEPFSTFASDVFRKISKKTGYHQASPSEVLIGMISNPSYWQNEPIIKVSNDKLEKELGGINGYVAFNQLFDFENGNAYKLSEKVETVYHKEPTLRDKYDKEILNVDERINICYEIYTGALPAFLPVIGQPGAKWTTLSGEMTTAQTMTPLLHPYLVAVSQASKTGNWQQADIALQNILNYQQQNGGTILPSNTQIGLEKFYNEWNIFGLLAKIYAMLGMVLLLMHLFYIFNTKSSLGFVLEKSVYLFWLLFALYTIGLGIRWYISGHAPWSNGYESMIFVGWATSLSGIVFAKRSTVSLAITSVLAGIILFVAGMSWMNPEITPLVPVLKSYWLIIHVAVITSSYGFLAMAALLGLLNLSLMVAHAKVRTERLSDSILEISYIIELAMIIGLMLLTAGCFIGAVWANESWGRYWGWDPKETWALVSIITYTAILHLRNVPAANNRWVLSSLSVLGFSTIIMTFFGVNYYLTGMHSYAQDSPPAIPKAVYLVAVGIFVLIAFAYRAYKKEIKNL